jgi:hypothetical protein
MVLNPVTTFLIVLVIGIAVGLIFDRVLGPGWFRRQITGAARQMVTSALVGVAGSFVGYHLALILAFGRGIGGLIGAALGAAVVLYLWRMVR